MIGIDPGLSGAVAQLCPGGILRVWDTPTIKVKRGVTKRKGKTAPRIVRELDEAKYLDILCLLHDELETEAYLEKVGSMKDQGVASSFAFGQVYGGQRVAIVAANIEYTLVTPQRWKLAMGCGADKNSSLVACLKAFPGYDHLWFGPKQGTLDGRCEAALIALYGSKQHGDH